MKSIAAILLAAASTGAFAAGSISLAYMPNSDIDLTPAGAPLQPFSGDGFSLQGTLTLGERFFLYGDHSDRASDLTTSPQDFKVRTSRAGLALNFPTTFPTFIGANFERIKINQAGTFANQDGFAARAGFTFPAHHRVHIYAEAGYIVLDDLDGYDYSLGASVGLLERLALFTDYRSTALSGDRGANLDIADIRVGLQFEF